MSRGRDERSPPPTPACTCAGRAPYCWVCIEAASTGRNWRTCEQLGREWGCSVWERRPGETWPEWTGDSPESRRMRDLAYRKVYNAIGKRDQRVYELVVLERLGRCVGVVAGRAYASMEAGRDPRGGPAPVRREATTLPGPPARATVNGPGRPAPPPAAAIPSGRKPR